MKMFMFLLRKNQGIRSKVFIKIFMSVLMKNQQEKGSNLLMKIFMALLTKKSTRNRV